MKIYVVGLGPGSIEQMTGQALEALEESQVIIGYDVYIDLIRERFGSKTLLSTPMKKEVDRCHMVMEEAEKGQIVSMVCSGDAGVYGMAGLLYEVSREYEPMEIEVISGVTAATGGAAVLGAPLTHDFAVISLSDLLTPLALIEKRLEAAALADFVICLYNPSSKKRRDYLEKACNIIGKHRSWDTVCGYVQNIGREGEAGTVLSLAQLRNTKVDMFTTVYIGNSQTITIGGKMVTPRGYHLKSRAADAENNQ